MAKQDPTRGPSTPPQRGWIEYPHTVDDEPDPVVQKDWGNPVLMIVAAGLVLFFVWGVFASPKAPAPAPIVDRVEIGEGIVEHRAPATTGEHQPSGDLGKQFADNFFEPGFHADDLEVAPAPDQEIVSNWEVI